MTALLQTKPAMAPSPAAGPSIPEGPESAPFVVPNDLSFDDLYEAQVDFVWRSLKSLGVQESSLDDAVQDVFLVIHRRLAEFEGRSSVSTWVFGIALHVARDHRRRERRKGGNEPLDFEIVDRAPGPEKEAENVQALHLLALTLDELDEAKRDVFVMAEIEEMTAVQIAELLGVNVNTVYSRIRAARRDFEAAFERHQGARR